MEITINLCIFIVFKFNTITTEKINPSSKFSDIITVKSTTIGNGSILHNNETRKNNDTTFNKTILKDNATRKNKDTSYNEPNLLSNNVRNIKNTSEKDVTIFKSNVTIFESNVTIFSVTLRSTVKNKTNRRQEKNIFFKNNATNKYNSTTVNGAILLKINVNNKNTSENNVNISSDAISLKNILQYNDTSLNNTKDTNISAFYNGRRNLNPNAAYIETQIIQSHVEKEFKERKRDELFYEPYWENGEWVFHRTGTPQTNTPTLHIAIYRGCEWACSAYLGKLYSGPVCSQRYDNQYWDYEYREFPTICAMETANCENEFKSWFPVRYGKCYELTTYNYKQLWEGVENRANLYNAIYSLPGTLPTRYNFHKSTIKYTTKNIYNTPRWFVMPSNDKFRLPENVDQILNG